MYQLVRCFLMGTDGKFILVRHKGKTKWSLPGGHIEKGENIYKALKREIMEELNIKITILGHTLGIKLDNLKELPSPLCIYKIKYTNKKGKEEKRVEYIFLAEVKKDQIIKTQIEEIDEYKLFTAKEIENLKDTYNQTKEIAKSLSI